MRNASLAQQTTSDRLATVLSYGALLLLGYLVYRIFEPFLVPLAWSAVLAIFFYPMYEHQAKRMTPGRAALLSTLAVTFLLIVPALLVLFYTARQGLEASEHLQAALAVHGQGPDRGFLTDAEAWLLNHLPASMHSVDLAAQLQQGVEKVG